MNRSLRQIRFAFFPAAPLCLILFAANNTNALAQDTVSQGDCQQTDAPCTTISSQQEGAAPQLQVHVGSSLAVPAMGLGQIAIISAGAGPFALQDEVNVVKNEPYQAEAVTEMKQTLADGSHIVQTTTATVARDNDGRTVRIQKLNTIGPWRSADSSQGNSQTLTTIFDPVAKEHIDFTSGGKVAHVLPLPPLPPGAVAGAETEAVVSVSTFAAAPISGVARGFAVQTRAVSPQTSEGMKPQTESLGTKTVEGVQVNGTRSRTTIPVGAIGNDKALVITRETWYSPELQLVVQSTQNDPRFGQTSYTLKNIQQGQPDETLFQVPRGYTIDKVVPTVLKAPAQ